MRDLRRSGLRVYDRAESRRSVGGAARPGTPLQSPFGETPIGVPPRRCPPAHRTVRSSPYCGFVALHAQPGLSGWVDIAVADFEDRAVDEIIQQIVADVVVNPEALLLNDRVRRGEVDLQASSQRDRAERAVRGE